MGLVGLVMAGGRGSRMGVEIEKPLASLKGRAMIELVVETLEGASGIEEIVVATSPQTPKTRELAEKLGLRVIETPGEDYVKDAQRAIRSLLPNAVLVISADLPQVSSRLINKIITYYLACCKPSLKVVTRITSDESKGADTPKSLDEEKSLRPVGINIIDSRHIDEPEIEEASFQVDPAEVGINVNRPEDLKILLGEKLLD